MNLVFGTTRYVQTVSAGGGRISVCSIPVAILVWVFDTTNGFVRPLLLMGAGVPVVSKVILRVVLFSHAASSMKRYL